jgi:hypothetical protein
VSGGESPEARKRRLAHEHQLAHVGVESPRGQALLAKWHREEVEARRKAAAK